VHILFCCDPVTPARVDPAFERELAAVRAVGAHHSLVSFEALVAGNAAAAVAAVRRDEGVAIYRGWMLTIEQYASLHAALGERGVRLIHSPEQYRYGHWFVESHSAFAHESPASVARLGEIAQARVGRGLLHS
jgi:hypothetical protein